MRYLSTVGIILISTFFLGADIFSRDNSLNKIKKGENVTALSLTTAETDICWPAHDVVHSTGEIDIEYDCYGQFQSFVSPSGSLKAYLFLGAVWVGGIIGQDTLVSVGHDGAIVAQELYPSARPFQPTVTRFEYTLKNGVPTNLSTRSEFYDTVTYNLQPDYLDGRYHQPMNLRLVNYCHTWVGDPLDRTAVFDLVITNIGFDLIEDGYLGLYFDADIFSDEFNPDGYLDDLAGSLRNRGIGYTIDNDGDLSPDDASVTRIFALKFLKTSFLASDTSFNWWVYTPSLTVDFGPRRKADYRDFNTEGGMGVPRGDRNKYYMMRSREWDYDQVFTASIEPDDSVWMWPGQSVAMDITNGWDTKFMMAVGPFDLPPDSSIRILYTIFTGENVHTDSHNFRDNILVAYQPETYLSGLDFSDVIQKADIAGSLGNMLTNPANPPLGLRISYTDYDSVVIEWEPWVFDNIEGYRIYLTEIPDERIITPGMPQPWLEPLEMKYYADIGRVDEYVFSGLDYTRSYFVNLAHQTASGPGLPGEAAIINFGWRPVKPEITNASHSFLLVSPGEPAVLEWLPPSSSAVDYYNIYKIAPTDIGREFSLPYYTEGCSYPNIPRDSFYIEGHYFYYYAMMPYARVNAFDTVFEDLSFSEGDRYTVSYTDITGLESFLSEPVTVNNIEPITRDILVLTWSSPLGQMVTFDSISSFYSAVLDGFDYDIYKFHDSTGGNPDNFDWHVLAPYAAVIIDDGFANMFGKYGGLKDKLPVCLAHGSKLVYCGALSDLFDSYQSDWFFRDLLGIDTFYQKSILPFDSSLGFLWANPVQPELVPIAYDTTRYPFVNAFKTVIWPDTTTVPGVVTYDERPGSEILYRYNSRYPQTCPFEYKPVGLKTQIYKTETYTFGFHFWYTAPDQARALLRNIIDSTYTGCCIGFVGNVDCSVEEGPDITDIMRLIDYLYLSHAPLCCPAEADTDGGGGYPYIDPDITDITRLIDYLYLSHNPLPDCP
ncbi:MAG: fibronectin type III domain-containing protein [candidate division Zixibacteria bacterium]|nr:fibronectin type III domain-containing protein [candidate division Zixibacteria bacterium]